MKRLAFLFAAALLGLWHLPALGGAHVYSACSRGVYYCGKMHYISITNDNQVSHYEKAISTSNWLGPWDDQPNIRLPMPSGWTRQNPANNGVGEGIVIFGGYMMHYAVVFDASKTPHLICSTYDLAGGKFLANINGVMNPTVITPLSKNSSGIYGVAATVFDEKIYVFTNQFTVFTSDPKGQCYVLTNVIADGLADYNPLDAITFFPETGPPQVMVLFSYPGTGAHGAAYVIWEGPSALPLPSTSVVVFAADRVVQGGALVLGTLCGGHGNYFPPGQKVPCVQIFFLAVNQLYWGVHQYEYAIPYGTLTSQGDSTPESSLPRTQFRLFPWYISQPGKDGRTVLQQHVVINEYYCMDSQCAAGGFWKEYALNSDFLVPQNKDEDGPYGWQGTSTPTNTGETDEEKTIRRSYWSLIGVILGPAPYATNEKEAFEIKEFSNVDYGNELSGDIDHTDTWSNTMMVSSKFELKVGISKHLGISAKLDVGYAHGWEGSYSTITKTTAGVVLKCGSDDEGEGSFGTDGWGIFLSPTIVMQDNAVYACDYDVQNNVGTYLNMDIPTVAQGADVEPPNPPSLLVNSYRFKLQAPGGTGDQLPGLMTMQENPATGEPWKFPLSTDLESWHDTSWEAAGSPWEIIYGTGLHGGSSVVTVNQGSGADLPFSQSTTTKDSSGHTNSVKVRASAGISGQIKIKGFKVGLGETLTAGYDGEWTSDTTTTTDISKSLTISYHFPLADSSCTSPECVTKLEVQPFLLLATDESAPWIPADYYQCRPWCITWQAVSGCYADGRCFGTSPPPAEADATIVGQGGVGEDGNEEAAGTRSSEFTIHGGHLTWLERDGSQTPLPITADGFDPGLGASVRVNRREFTTDLTPGKWTRKGQVWKFETKKSVTQDAFTLKLDFGANTWDFVAKKLDIAGHFPAGDMNCRVDLLINGKYRLSTAFVGEGVLRYKQRNNSLAQGSLIGLTDYSGVVGSSGQDDRIQLAGTLPNDLPPFGDLLFAINGQDRGVPLLGLRDFKDSVEHGRNLTYDSGGIRLAIDFKKKTWSAIFKGEAAKAIVAARWGGARIAVHVGGEPWCTQKLDIKRYTAKLRYKS